MSKSTFSKTTTWILRILLFIVIIFGLILFALSFMAGTSESHRKGLEQAFSDFLKADIEIGRLEQFNILPQLVFKTSDIHGTFHDTKNEFLVDHLEVAFGLTDLMQGKSRIENFQLQNLRFANAAALDLRMHYAGIEKVNKEVLFSARGNYQKNEFSISVPIQEIKGGRPSYQFSDAAPVKGRFGSLDIQAEMQTPEKGKTRVFRNVIFSKNGKTLMTGESKAEANKPYKIMLECALAADEAVEEIRTLQSISFLSLAESCPK